MCLARAGVTLGARVGTSICQETWLDASAKPQGWHGRVGGVRAAALSFTPPLDGSRETAAGPSASRGDEVLAAARTRS